jgi:hypothetical protein
MISSQIFSRLRGKCEQWSIRKNQHVVLGFLPVVMGWRIGRIWSKRFRLSVVWNIAGLAVPTASPAMVQAS